MKIHLKSALCGLAVGVLAMLVIGAESANSSDRYQITSAGSPVCAFVLDKATGRVWATGFVTTAEMKKDPGFYDSKTGN